MGALFPFCSTIARFRLEARTMMPQRLSEAITKKQARRSARIILLVRTIAEW
jgi:hypothetical protein